jgi:hypothetical protein
MNFELEQLEAIQTIHRNQQKFTSVPNDSLAPRNETTSATKGPLSPPYSGLSKVDLPKFRNGD